MTNALPSVNFGIFGPVRLLGLREESFASKGLSSAGLLEHEIARQLWSGAIKTLCLFIASALPVSQSLLHLH